MINWLSPALWTGIAFAIVMAWGGIQTLRLDACHTKNEAIKATFDAFRATVAAEGKKAQEMAAQKEKADKLSKETADAENAKAVVARDAVINRLRSERSSSSYAPATAPASQHPERACFVRTDFDRALSNFVEGTGQLIEECDRTRIDLDTAKHWAGKLATTLGTK